MIVPGGRTTPTPEPATVQEIRQIEREMIDSAVRAKRAEFDGVEVAAHMSYLAASFLSPRTNQRTDEYGGSAENRARMLSNVVAGIRKECGADFVIGLRLAANDLMPGGQGARGFAEVARHVEAAGLDYVALSYGCYETMDASAPAEDGGMIDSGDARVFKEALRVPVLVQGETVAENRLGEIVKCRRDNYCIRRMVFGMPVRCEANREMGRESRAGGSFPPVERMLKRPVESVVLGVTGSAGVMKVLGSLKKPG
jgi:2,4-dienoyl-CoA reductase (NADPH2)